MRARRQTSLGKRLFSRVLSFVGAIGLTVLCFLVLPVIQAIADDSEDYYETQEVDVYEPPPPPEFEEEEPEEEEPEEEPPPEMDAEEPLIDLAQLDLSMGPGFSDGWLGGDFAVTLKSFEGQGGAADELFSLSDLDQRPRPIDQPGPTIAKKLARKGGGQVTLIFIVDEKGRVQNAKVKAASDPDFREPALKALRKWRFEPGRRKGKAVSTRTKVTITFPDRS